VLPLFQRYVNGPSPDTVRFILPFGIVGIVELTIWAELCVKFVLITKLAVSEAHPETNYTYQWSNGATTSSLMDLPNGTYTVILTAGCASDTASFVISTNLTQSSAQIVNSTIPTMPNGSINLTVSGDGPFTYLWNNGSTAEDLNGIISGTYSVVVTNANGCIRSASSC